MSPEGKSCELTSVWTVGDRIGGGGFGEVYEVTSESESESAVAKFVPKAPGGDRELLFVDLDGDRLVLYVPPELDAEARRGLLGRWHREQLRERLPSLISAWEPKVRRQVSRWSIRPMKTKWGSCNRESGHIWFNLELATKHPDCLEYIVVHEMAHLVERNHGDRFTKLMDQLLPDWRSRRDRLNEAPLAHQSWETCE